MPSKNVHECVSLGQGLLVFLPKHHEQFSHLMPWHLIPSHNISKFFRKFHRSCVSSRLPRPLLTRSFLLPRRRLLLWLLVVAVVVAAVIRPLLPLLRRALLGSPLLPAAFIVRLELCLALLCWLSSTCRITIG